MRKLNPYAGWPESLLNSFQKVSLLGQKKALNFGASILRFCKNCSRAFGGQSYLAYKIQEHPYMFMVL